MFVLVCLYIAHAFLGPVIGCIEDSYHNVFYIVCVRVFCKPPYGLIGVFAMSECMWERLCFLVCVRVRVCVCVCVCVCVGGLCACMCICG